MSSHIGPFEQLKSIIHLLFPLFGDWEILVCGHNIATGEFEMERAGKAKLPDSEDKFRGIEEYLHSVWPDVELGPLAGVEKVKEDSELVGTGQLRVGNFSRQASRERQADDDRDTSTASDSALPAVGSRASTDQTHPEDDAASDYSTSSSLFGGHVDSDSDGEPSTSTNSDAGVLVRTPLLDKFSLVFNRDYRLFICKGCKEGMALRSVHNHLSSRDSIKWDPVQRKRDKLATPTDHPPVPRFSGHTKKKEEFHAGLVQSLVASGYLSEEESEDVLDCVNVGEWQEVPGDWRQGVPVEGLQVWPGYKCDLDECQYATRSSEVFRKAHKIHRDFCTPASVQSFSMAHMIFFAVDTPKQDSESPPNPVPQGTERRLRSRTRG